MATEIIINAQTGETTTQEYTPVVSEAEIRAMRNQFLADCDWTQVADAPVDQAAWATYRQALRDIPQQTGFPEDVVWPTEPE
jgi:hypothetical protein